MGKSKEKPLQMSLFERGMTETVAVTELYGAEPGGIFDFIGTNWTQETIVICWGDLKVMCDALVDYAGILDRVIVEWEMDKQSEYKATMYRIHAARCRKIAAKYGAAIGYDREAALEKCRKKMDKQDDDVGEEAMALLVKRGVKPGKEGKDAPQAETGAKEVPQPEERLDQITMGEV